MLQIDCGQSVDSSIYLFGFAAALFGHWGLTNATLVTAAEVFAPFLEILLIRIWFRPRIGNSVLAIVLANLTSWWVGGAFFSGS